MDSLTLTKQIDLWHKALIPGLKVKTFYLFHVLVTFMALCLSY